MTMPHERTRAWLKARMRSTILGKASLPAEDHKITDRIIMARING